MDRFMMAWRLVGVACIIAALVIGAKAKADDSWAPFHTQSDASLKVWQPQAITFQGEGGKTILVLHADGRIEVGKGVKPDKAARAFIAAVARAWPGICVFVPERAP